jgi:predicted HD superfamily hydrolase involved in NAD metabolism
MICTADTVRRLLVRTLSPERQRHSQGVARTAAALCRRFGVDPEKGRLAGLAHDLARELPPGRILALAAQDGRGLSEEERRHPLLLHGRAAAVILGREAGVDDPEIAEALRCHVTGCPGMGRLARIVFVADYVEPGRSFVTPGFRRSVLRLELDAMVLHVLEQVEQYLREEGIPMADAARKLHTELEGAG